MTLVKSAKYMHCLPIFSTLRISLTLKQMLVKLFANSIIINTSNNFIKYKRVNTFYFFEMVYLDLHTVIALYRLNWNEKLLEIFAYLSNNREFYRPKLNL